MSATSYAPYGASVYVKGAAAEYNVSVVAQRRDDHDYAASVVALGTQTSEKGVSSVGTISESLPNQFYGIAEIAPVTVNYDNQDGAFTFLLTDEVRGSPVRIRRFNEVDSESVVLYEGIIERISVGLDDASIDLANVDTALLSTPLPHLKVNQTTTVFQDTQPSDGAITPNIIYGYVTKVPLALVSADSVNSNYDYLVGEGVCDPITVYRNGLLTTQQFIQTSTLYSAPNVGSQYSEILLLNNTIVFTDETLIGMYIRVLAAAEGVSPFTSRPQYEGLTYRIVGTRHPLGATGQPDTTKIYLQFSEDISGITTGMSSPTVYLILQEYGILFAESRTYIRFGVQQDVENAPAAISADVQRYSAPRKNLLFNSDRLGNDYCAIPLETYGIKASFGGAWIPAGFGSPAFTGLATGYPGPDQITRLVGITVSTTDKNEQSILYPLTGSDKVTLSVWIYDRYASGSFRLTITSDGGSVTPSTNTYTYVNDLHLHRVTATKTTGWGTSPTKIICRIDSSVSADVLAFGIQLEVGTSATWYEAVGPKLFGAKLERPVQVIRDLIEAPYGLNERVDVASFEAAETAVFQDTALSTNLQWPFLRAQGVLPDLTGTIRTAKDVLDELCMLRGFKLRKKGGAWVITADTRRTGTPAVTLGTEETPYKNTIAVDPVQLSPLGDVVKTVRVNYGQEVFSPESGNAQILFPYSLEKDVNSVGQVKEFPLLMVRDHNTADRVLQYLSGWIPILDHRIGVKADWEARNVVVGDLITFVAPRLQPENLVVAGEQIGDGLLGWTDAGGPGANPFTNVDLDPFRRSFRTTNLTAGGSGSGITGVAVQTTVSVTGKHFVGFVWARSLDPTLTDVQNDFAIGIFNSSTSTLTGTGVSYPVGSSWRRYRVDHTFLAANSGFAQFWVYFPNSNSQTVQVWGAQLCLDYEAPYIYVDTYPVSPDPVNRTHVVVSTSRPDPVETDLILLPYTDVPFDYTKSDFPTRVTPTQTTDPRMVPPDLPTALVVASSGKDSITSGGTAYTEAWAYIQFIMPDNATEVIVQIQPYSGLGWVDVATVNAFDVPAGSVATVRASGLLPIVNYVVRAVAGNSFGLFSQSAVIYFSIA